MTTRPRSRIKTLLFASVIAVLGLLVLYAMLNVLLAAMGWRISGVYTQEGERLISRGAGAHGGAFEGPLRGELYHPDFSVPWILNEHGFRERPLQPKQPGEYRIALLGDSMAAGWGVERDERFADRWFAQVAPGLPDVTLWNLAASNTGTHHQADILEGVGAEYGFDEVVLAFFSGNDMRDNLRWNRAQTGTSTETQSRRPLRNFLRKDPVATFFWLNGVALLARGVRDKELEAVSPSDKQWAMTEAGLDRVAEAAGSRPLTIWYVPTRVEWNDEHWAAARAEFGLPDDSRRDDMLRRVEGWAKPRGARVVDLTPALHEQPDEAVRYPNDGHYTAEGNRRLAEALYADGNEINRRGRGASGG